MDEQDVFFLLVLVMMMMIITPMMMTAKLTLHSMFGCLVDG